MRSAYVSYDTFYLQAKVSPLEIAFVEIILLKINKRGRIKNVLGRKFMKNYLAGGTSIRNPRICSSVYLYVCMSAFLSLSVFLSLSIYLSAVQPISLSIGQLQVFFIRKGSVRMWF